MHSEKRDLISIEDFSNEEIEEIFSMADEMLKIIKGRGRSDDCYGKIMATLFFEPSTRTRFSFETAIQRLGGGLISAPDMSVTSTKKGETLSDTIKTVSQYADIIVMRHPHDGAAKVASEVASVPVINAGDGKHEHPTQTLLDLYTLKKEKGRIKDLTVALCGDLEYGRTIHSLAYGLARFGANVIFIPAKGHQIPFYVSYRLANFHQMKLRRNILPPDLKLIGDKIDVIYMTPSRAQQDFGFVKDVKEFNIYVKELYLEDTLKKWSQYDSVYITRIQKERFTKLDESNKTITPKEDYPVINGELLKYKKYRDTAVMHPLPRVDELSLEVNGDKRAIYFKQAAYGVPIRMALIAYLLGLRKMGFKYRKIDHEEVCSDKEIRYISCENQNCISYHEKKVLPQQFRYPKREKINGFHALIYLCAYCDIEVCATHAGSTQSKKYFKIHPSLDEKIKEWRDRGYLVVFKSEEEAKEKGFKPYKPKGSIQILDQKGIEAGILKIADQIGKTEDLENLVFVGIEKEGKVIAERLAGLIKEKSNIQIPIAGIDTNPYRDDRSIIDADENNQAKIPFSINKKTIILVDDVISTGRTARAALDVIFDSKVGRPKEVKLAAMINVENFRELPINPDMSIEKVDLRGGRIVKVRLKEIEKVDEAVEYSAARVLI